MNGYGGNKLLEFDTMNKFKAGLISKTYDLPSPFDGTGAVVYGGHLYYNKYTNAFYNITLLAVMHTVAISRWSMRISI